MPWSREIRDPCGYRDDKERSTKECHKAKIPKEIRNIRRCPKSNYTSKFIASKFFLFIIIYKWKSFMAYSFYFVFLYEKPFPIFDFLY